MANTRKNSDSKDHLITDKNIVEQRLFYSSTIIEYYFLSSIVYNNKSIQVLQVNWYNIII